MNLWSVKNSITYLSIRGRHVCDRGNKTTSVHGVEEVWEAIVVESKCARVWSLELVRAMRPHLSCLPQRKAEGLDHGGQGGLKVDSRECRLGSGFYVPLLYKAVDYALDFELVAEKLCRVMEGGLQVYLLPEGDGEGNCHVGFNGCSGYLSISLR